MHEYGEASPLIKRAYKHWWMKERMMKIMAESMKKALEYSNSPDKVEYLSIAAAKACPYCSRHHFDINQAISFYRCECGAVFQSLWHEKEQITLYTWLKPGQPVPDVNKGWDTVKELGNTHQEVVEERIGG
jgi:hypothetical protein